MRTVVPLGVPLDFHSWLPLDGSSNALKYSRLPDFTSEPGSAPSVPDMISLTSTVPAAVPLLFQSSRPKSGWNAEKKSVPFTFVRWSGSELFG